MEQINVKSTKKNEIIDITSQIKEIISQSNIKEGICTIFAPHATCAVMINENYDPNICDDILDSLNENIPERKWRHDKIDNNAAAHIKASIIGPSETIIIKDSNLLLGQWQDIMIADFDGPRNRTILVKIISS